jgi:hypothetical protein
MTCNIGVYEAFSIDKIPKEQITDSHEGSDENNAIESLRSVLDSCGHEFHWECNADEMSSVNDGIKYELEDRINNWHLRSYKGWAVEYDGVKAIIDITGLTYWCSADQKESAERDISDIVEEVAKKPNAKSKALAIHNWLAKRVEYSKNLTSKSKHIKNTRAYHMAHNAAGSLVVGWYHGKGGGYGVCSSYSGAFDIIASRCGLDSHMVHSKTHRWNQVRSEDGKWYNVDVTFDDGEHKISRKWFWISDKRLSILDTARKSSAHVAI